MEPEIQMAAPYGGAQVLDLTDMIRNAKEKIYYDGLHMGARGNALVAQNVATDTRFICSAAKPNAQAANP